MTNVVVTYERMKVELRKKIEEVIEEDGRLLAPGHIYDILSDIAISYLKANESP